MDPLSASYPYNSPYAFSENRVIDGVELEGLEFRLKIFSPEISAKFLKAKKENDLFRMRELTWRALNQKTFPDDWAYRRMSGQDHNGEFVDMFNFPGEMEYDASIQGLEVLLWQFDYANGQPFRIIPGESFSWYTGKGQFFDKYWPVDVRDTDAYTSATGKSFYTDNEGKEMDINLFSFGAVGTKGAGAIAFMGHFRGLGYVEGTFDISDPDIRIGGVTGVYNSNYYHPSDAFKDFKKGFMDWKNDRWTLSPDMLKIQHLVPGLLQKWITAGKELLNADSDKIDVNVKPWVDEKDN